MAHCPKCKKYVDKVTRSLMEVHEVDDVGDIVTMNDPHWEYSKFRHECGYEFNINRLGTFINIVGDEDV